MNDRELLEAAAKAAGIAGEYRTEHLCINGDWLDATAIHTEDEWWDPLEDDGDALRLAVRLHLWVDCDTTLCNVIAYKRESCRVGAVEFYKDDPYAATRRAIVRAAAVMDKEKA
jgi:hypothetical protein